MINHVVSLEVAKKLKEYVKINSFFRWYAFKETKGDDWEGELLSPDDRKSKGCMVYDSDFYPAPLLSEMLELLPEECDINNACSKDSSVVYYEHGDPIGVPYSAGDNLATKAALLYIHLKERGLV